MDMNEFKAKWKSCFVNGDIHLHGYSYPVKQEEITALPSNLHVTRKMTSGVNGANTYEGGSLGIFNLPDLAEIPEGVRADDSFDVHYCHSLTTLPLSINPARQIGVRHCNSFEKFPAGNYRAAYIGLEDLPKLNSISSGLKTNGDLLIRRCPSLASLSNIEAWNRLVISECEGLKAIGHEVKTGVLIVTASPNLESLPDDIDQTVSVGLIVNGATKLPALPSVNPDWTTLDMSGCTGLINVPDQIALRSGNARLNLSGCSSLENFPHKMIASEIDITGCTAVREITGTVKSKILEAGGCSSLTRLPDDMAITWTLNLSQCNSLTELPNNLHVGGSLILRGTGVRELPHDLSLGDNAWVDVRDCDGIRIPQELIDSGNVRLMLPGSYEVIPAREVDHPAP
ncbi:hypothetical protein AA14337_3396 [Acetobacter malorum DSM 14337]|uniref:Uncharacterized protein n=1 Tax=Acetobacter malorum DSM 14337 TaxID=1307910 RepID=A0ABQ0Q1D0_9PROT|nr:hypothetical protein [Acetobacter malorum]KXV06533.1 hypothetical protein AD930_08040 [Acetobacter malorum]GBQ86716.1 hypothetical protein AA14337_3396 [Acetobacter malorum DSM 14337]